MDITENHWNLYNEDCLIGMKKIPDHSIDMVIADPPYGVTHLAYDTVIDMNAFFKEVWRVCRQDAAVLMFGVEPFLSKIRLNESRTYRYDIIWEKTICTGFLNAHKMPLKSYEVISVFYKKAPIYNPQMTTVATHAHRIRGKSGNSVHYGKYARDDYRYIETGERFPKDIIKIPNPHGNCTKKSDRNEWHHPSAKPTALLSYLIRTYSRKGDHILDPFAGGGNACIAAMENNRIYTGFELNTEYFRLTEEKIQSTYGSI